MDKGTSRGIRDFVLGGTSAMMATIFTNPLEVVKTRMQLQGELKGRGQHAVHYRNVAHALYAIVKIDGFPALLHGVAPMMGFQLCLNSCRLGIYRICERNGLTKKADGNTALVGSMAAGALGGFFGGITGSPFNLIKTRLQAQATNSIAVGHQHQHTGMLNAFKGIYQTEGVKGMFRGMATQIPRGMIGSSSQLVCFNVSKDFLRRHELFVDSKIMTSFLAANTGGLVMTFLMNPFDVVGTRLYNQAVDAQGKGLLYRGMTDCFVKLWKTEGLLGFYKGVWAAYLRLGPHTVLLLVFWDQLVALENYFEI